MTLENYISYLAVVSLIAFVAYAFDKWRAVNCKRRIRENILLGVSFLGGAVGGYLAMLLCWHKVRRLKFHIVNLVGIVWQIGLLLYFMYDPSFLGTLF